MKTVFFSLLIAALVANPYTGNAQADNDSHGGEENSLGSGHMPSDSYDQSEEKSLDLGFDSPQPTEIPFDGGASLLLIAGAAYGVKKASSRLKNKHQSVRGK